MNLFDVYPLFDVEIKKGKGCLVYDTEGTEYLDLYGGHAVISVGHTHPHYIAALNEQAQNLVFYSNSVHNSLQKRLAELLGKACGYDDYQLFLINSGAEANENALKLASFHNGRRKALAFSKAFHGRTSLAVGATDNKKIVAPINDNGNIDFLPFNDAEAAAKAIASKQYCAVIVEGIQGVGGVQIPTPEFLQAIRKACDETDTVMVLDEIQSGYGRSGKFFAHQHAGVKADVVTMAKGIANGFPMGALIINPKYKPTYGMLGTTFGGNHLACAAAIAVLEIFEKENLVQNAAEVGEYLISELKKIDGIKEVRGKGLMIGMEFEEPAKELRKKLLFEQHVFTGASGTNVIRLLPPLVITKAQAEEFIKRLKTAMQ